MLECLQANCGQTDVGRTNGHRRTMSDYNSLLSTPCSCELKVDGKELWFLYSALFCNVINVCVKFEVTSFYTSEVMPRTKIHSKNFKMVITGNRNEIEL